MDFGAVLHTAHKNEKTQKAEVKYYSTKFEPPKKQQRSKELSVNVKKFLAKKEQEEKRKLEEARKKKDELLALRAQDKKATRRVNVMLKRTKSANQSVIQDAVDEDNTAVTLAGPAQPDEDDYGYVSQEASAFYNKMMEKYNKMPEEKKFDFTKKKVDTNLKNTKDRVKAALEKEREDALLPHKRKRKHKDSSEGSISKEVEEEKYEPEKVQCVEKPKHKHKPAPPLNFADLLKIAEKKQFEPIVIEAKPKEEEKLLTKKQKREMEIEKQYRERRENREKELKSVPQKKAKVEEKPGKLLTSDRIPKVNIEKPDMRKPYIPSSKNVKPTNALNNKYSDRGKESILSKALTSNSNKLPLQQSLGKSKVKDPNVYKTNNNINRDEKYLSKQREIVSKDNKSKTLVHSNSKELLQKDLQNKKPKKFPVNDFKVKESSKDLKLKQHIPPPDMSRFPIKKKPLINHRRILDDDDSEYDSEMDDFIDDGPEENDNYSKYISEIFGYDKSRYRDVDDNVDNMETSFAQQMKEEAISKKIGIMEDLEDMKMEEEMKKRKKAKLSKNR